MTISEDYGYSRYEPSGPHPLSRGEQRPEREWSTADLIAAGSAIGAVLGAAWQLAHRRNVVRGASVGAAVVGGVVAAFEGLANMADEMHGNGLVERMR